MDGGWKFKITLGAITKIRIRKPKIKESENHRLNTENKDILSLYFKVFQYFFKTKISF